MNKSEARITQNKPVTLWAIRVMTTTKDPEEYSLGSMEIPKVVGLKKGHKFELSEDYHILTWTNSSLYWTLQVESQVLSIRYYG